MANSNAKFDSVRDWIVEHKLCTFGCLWLSGIAGPIASNWSQPNMKTSVRIIHVRLDAQALTLAALAGAPVVEWYDHKSGAKAERYAKFLPIDDFNTHKDELNFTPEHLQFEFICVVLSNKCHYNQGLLVLPYMHYVAWIWIVDTVIQ